MRKHLIWFCVVLASLLVWFAWRDRGPAAIGSLGPSSETRTVERGEGPAPLDAPSEIGVTSARDLSAEPETSPTVSAGASTPSDATVVVELRIVDIDGSPIPGAEVETREPSPPASATADAQGVARLALPRLPDRNLEIEARADGYFHYRNQLFGVLRPPPIVLNPIARVTGNVVDAETGAAIAGARVRAPHDRCGADCPTMECVTDIEGRFELDCVQAGVDVQWIVTAEGYIAASGKLPVPADTADARVKVALVPGVRFVGRVVDLATSLPVEGARVLHEFDSVTSDVNGEFALHVDGALHPFVYVERSGYAQLFANIGRLDPDGPPVDLRLPPLVAITGVVRDATGRPVAGATVGVTGGRRSDALDAPPLSTLPSTWNVRHAYSEGTTDTDGRFRVVGAVAWRSGQLLWVSADGHRKIQVALPPCPLPGEERIDVVLEPVAHAVITGMLTVNGLPETGYVSWSADGEHVGTRVLNGSFRIERVEPGLGELSAFNDNYEEFGLSGASVSLTIEPGTSVHHDFALQIRLLPISGHVRFSEGRPAAGVIVSAAQVDDRHYAHATADEGGAYVLSVPAVTEPYTVTVFGGGIQRHLNDVAAGDSDVDFDLGATGALRVRALDARSREPILDASFDIRPLFPNDKWMTPPTTAHPSGWREVELASGSWRIVASAGERGYAAAWQAAGIVAGETTNLELALPRGVRVIAAGGPQCETRIAHVWLVEESLAEEAEHLLPERDARKTVSETLVEGVTIFRDLILYDVPQPIEGVAPGRYRLLSTRGNQVFEPAVLVVPDDVESVRFDVVWRKASPPPR